MPYKDPCYVSVSRATYERMLVVVDELRSRLPVRGQRHVSIAALIDSALAGWKPDAAFVERVRARPHGDRRIVVSPVPQPSKLTRVAELPQPTGRDVFAPVDVAVSDELYEMVDDQVTRVRELEQRDVGHGDVFKAALRRALSVAERQRRAA